MKFYKSNVESMNLLLKYFDGKLPPKLTKEQLKLMIGIAQAGNIGVRNAIIESYYNMILDIAIKCWKPWSEIDDLFQVGVIGCIKAINTFKTDMPLTFTSYAYPVIANDIRMYLRSLSSKNKHVVSIDEVMYTDKDGSDIYLLDILADDDIQNSPELYTDAIITRELVLSTLSKLRPDDQRLIELRFGLNGEQKHTQDELAEIYDRSQCYICRKIKAILFTMRKDLSF